MDELPHNLAAEAGLIGAILFNNASYERVRHRVSEDDFYAAEHQCLWKELSSRLDEGKTADTVTLHGAVDNNPVFQFVGGVAYLNQLLDYAVFGPEIDDYAFIISDTARRRELIGATHNFRNDLTDTRSSAEAVTKYQATLETIQDQTPTGSIGALSASVEDTLFYDDRYDMLSSGYSALDHKIGGFERGAVSVIGAGTGMGKSALNICLMVNIAEAGESVGLLSMDMTARTVRQRMACYMLNRSGKHTPTFRQVKDRLISEGQRRDLAAAIEQPHARQIFVDERGGLTAKDIEDQIRAWKLHCKREGLPPLGAVFVDHIGKVNPCEYSRSSYDRASTVSKELLELAKRHPEIALIELAQINRASPTERRRPRTSDLRDSGKIEEDATLILLLHREEWHLQQIIDNELLDEDEREKARRDIERHRGRIEVIVGKNRNGPTGAIVLQQSIAHNVIRDVDRAEKRNVA